MNREQFYKLLKVSIVATFLMLVCEIVFAIDGVNLFFARLVTSTNGFWVYAVIWVIMFLQVTILNIPAYIVLSASVSVGLSVFGWQYLFTVIFAYMCGCILAYWLGRWWGVKAVKWCAGNEEDFNKWSNFINTKGKWYYFLTILLPIFPDDLLCIVAGSVKFDFATYCYFNLIGRSVGLITMLVFLKIVGSIGGGFPLMLVFWAIALIVELIAFFIVKSQKKH